MVSENNTLEDLADSADLLHLLERLTAGLATEIGEDERLPWAGIQLTINQIREKISRVHRAVAAGQNVRLQDEPIEREVLVGKEYAPKRVANSPLASRIQMAPIAASGVERGRASIGVTREIRAAATAE